MSNTEGNEDEESDANDDDNDADEADEGEDDGEDDGEGEDEGEEDEDEDYFDVIESNYVIIKWVMAWVGLIITLAVLIVVISVPYLVTGEIFRSLDAGLVPRVDQEVSCQNILSQKAPLSI